MNPLSEQALKEIAEAKVAPIQVPHPSYIVQVPHRFGTFFGIAIDGYQTGSVTLYGEWCREESLLIESMLKPGDWVLDVGANTGSFTMAFANAVRDWINPAQSGKVLSFEPQLFPYHCLVANICANSLSHLVNPIRAALGKEDGDIPCPILDPRTVTNFGGCSLVQPELHSGQVHDVPLLAIDSLNLAACHFIKADVEGMESDVLAGAYATISKFQPIIWAEWASYRENAREDLLKAFDLHDYQAWAITTPLFSAGNIRRCWQNPFVGSDGGLVGDTNVLAIPKAAAPPWFITNPPPQPIVIQPFTP